MKTKIQNNIKAVILGLIVTLGMGYAAAATFNGPSCAPPGCNADAPINASTTAQTKTGPLTLMHLFTPDFTLTNSDGTITNIASGSVMLARGANTGTAKWSNSFTVYEDYGPGIRCPQNGYYYDSGGSAGAGLDFAYTCVHGFVKYFTTDNAVHPSDGDEVPRPKVKGYGNTGQFYSGYDTGATLLTFTVDGSGYLTRVCKGGVACTATPNADSVPCNWTGAWVGYWGTTTIYCDSNSKLYSIQITAHGVITPSTPYTGIMRKFNVSTPIQ